MPLLITVTNGTVSRIPQKSVPEYHPQALNK
jgi:hypothetical protein